MSVNSNEQGRLKSPQVRVFVSSTFKDMQAEREELMAIAWPGLRSWCRERGVEIVEVDLRWGISEEQSTRKNTLKRCLDEIQACRPFFIGLLGERYGWVPDHDAFAADLKEQYSWLKGLQGKSVTELEILHGVLNNPDMAGRAFFYFRDPAYAQTRGADFLPENDASASNQTALKTLIRATCAERQIPLREPYSDPRALASLVLEDLKGAITAQFPLKDVSDRLDREARDHEAFAEIHRRTYIARSEDFETLDSHAESVASPLVLLGDSGSGKSALLANWVDRWRSQHPADFVFEHYIGSTPDSSEHWNLLMRIIGEIKRWSGDPDELPRSHEQISRIFRSGWPRHARRRSATVCGSS